MLAQFKFELVSPEKSIFGPAEVSMVTVPGGEGDYGVLAEHAPMITTVRPGVIEVYDQNDNTVTERIFVAGGFAEVTGGRCTVLAEEATLVRNLNRAEIEAELKSLADDLAASKTDSERANIEARLAIVRAQFQALA